MMPHTPHTFRLIKEYLVITFGIFLFTVASKQFLLPSKLVSGGVSGISAIIEYATQGAMEMSYSYLAINVVLVAIGFAVLGRAFGVKTIYGILAVVVLLKVIPQPATPHVQDPLMAAIITGILSGVGLGITFTQGGSAGGTDIVALVINKYRNMSVGRVFIYVDLLIIGSSYLLHHSLETVAYGYVIMGVSSYCVDLVLSGNQQSVQFFIFSKHYEHIADRITSELKRGVTVLPGQGWYTKHESKVLLVLARKNEANTLYRIVKDEDPAAFVSVANVVGVYGSGFDKIKTSAAIKPAEMLAKATGGKRG